MRDICRDEQTERIAKNAAGIITEIAKNCFILNLGVGIPTHVADYISNENIYISAENGMLGVGPIATGREIHPQLINAGRQPVMETPGCSYFDSSLSFGMIRGGHVDATILGAFEVDQEANIANWIIPGGKQLGVGGAMDLVAGAKIVIVAMTHTGKKGAKLVRHCTLPITGKGKADFVVTELGVFERRDGEFVLTKIAPDLSIEELREQTELDFLVDKNLRSMV